MLQKYSRNKILSYFLLPTTFVISPIATLILVPIWMRNLKPVIGILVIAILFGLGAYYFEPDSTMDLAAYYHLYDNGIDLTDYYRGATGDLEKADLMIFCFFALMKQYSLDYHWLAAISGAIYFGGLATISFVWSRYLHNNLLTVPIFILLLISEYLLGFTGIRYDNSVIFLVLSISCFIWNRRKVGVAFGILAILFHFAAIPLFVVIVLSFFISTRKSKQIGGILFILGFVSLHLILALRPILASLGSIGMALSESINSYVASDGGVLYAGSRLWFLQRIVAFLFFLLIVMISSCSYKFNSFLQSIKLLNFIYIYVGYLFFVLMSPQVFMRSLLLASFMTVFFAMAIIYESMDKFVKYFSKVFVFIFILLGVLANISGKEFATIFMNPHFIVYDFSIWCLSS